MGVDEKFVELPVLLTNALTKRHHRDTRSLHFDQHKDFFPLPPTAHVGEFVWAPSEGNALQALIDLTFSCPKAGCKVQSVSDDPGANSTTLFHGIFPLKMHGMLGNSSNQGTL